MTAALAFQMPVELPARWYPLDYHPVQYAYWVSDLRYNCVSAGRRGGKSENAKRKLVKCAINFTAASNGKFIYCAPTRDQVKRIAWQDLKDLSPPELILDKSETELRITYVNGASVQCVGMDKPERVEGEPIDGCVIDEYGDMKENAFAGSIRPAISTKGRLGWCDFIGKPRGRNHWYRQVKRAQDPKNTQWGHFTWKSADIIGKQEAEDAKNDIDRATYDQEYNAEFLEPEGHAYHEFVESVHVGKQIYRSDLPLKFAFDFNVDPGVATISQDYDDATRVLAEVHIPLNSNTKKVAAELIRRFGQHLQPVYLYGDATGGARGTAKVEGSDWTILKNEFASAKQRNAVRWPSIKMRVPKANGPVVSRINAMNSRLLTASGNVHLFIDPSCAHLILDLNEVVRDDKGDIDKKSDKTLTHMSDAIGYQMVYDFALNRGRVKRTKI